MSVAMGFAVVIILVAPASRAKSVVALPPQASPVRNVGVLVVAQASQAKPEWSLHMSNFKLTH